MINYIYKDLYKNHKNFINVYLQIYIMVSNTKKFIEYYLDKNTEYPITIYDLMKEIKIKNYPYIYHLLKQLENENKIILAKRGKTLLIIK